MSTVTVCPDCGNVRGVADSHRFACSECWDALAETRLRKITKFEICERHAPWFAHATRYRKLECMVEGGPGGWEPGCEGGRCRLWPGTDVFEASVCTHEMALDWTVAE